MSEATETNTTEIKNGPGRPPKPAVNAEQPPNSDKLKDIVDELLRLVSHKKVRINHEDQSAGVDLGSRGMPSGLQYRQLVVKADAGFIAVRLIEGFKPMHGGSEQRKTLYSIVVPVGEAKAYGALQRRFFGYDLAVNVDNGKVFLDMVVETIAKSSFN
jgi:hypothetical protein